MKSLILFFLIFCSQITVDGQQYRRVRKVVSLLPEQSFYLNGGVRASLGGKSRVYYEIILPPNTVEWYYTFTTSVGDQGTANLKLASQLTRLVDPSGISSIAVSALFTPSGVASADVYLCNRNNIDLFIQKVDNNGGTFSYQVDGTRENYKQGTVPIKAEIQGVWYLGIKNPSSTEGINVNLEVAAIVEEREVIKLSTEDEKAKAYGNMGWNAYLKGDYSRCIELSKKSLEYNSAFPWVKCNIALCYLVQNSKEYLDSYVDAIAACKASDNPQAYLLAAIKDIQDAQRKLGTIVNADEILSLLKQEIK